MEVTGNALTIFLSLFALKLDPKRKQTPTEKLTREYPKHKSPTPAKETVISPRNPDLELLKATRLKPLTQFRKTRPKTQRAADVAMVSLQGQLEVVNILVRCLCHGCA
ncbi:SNF2 superfamily protein [Corchorus olitorius]|uniref:SNF2 superfamily protein n=1 Tax=Corchorus olitorius TaxID=93759 RepID=A0A1R3GCS4_9ROSI|nr:SNF2 superfamily protein [Corchorus olitorius]